MNALCGVFQKRNSLLVHSLCHQPTCLWELPLNALLHQTIPFPVSSLPWMPDSEDAVSSFHQIHWSRMSVEHKFEKIWLYRSNDIEYVHKLKACNEDCTLINPPSPARNPSMKNSPAQRWMPDRTRLGGCTKASNISPNIRAKVGKAAPSIIAPITPRMAIHHSFRPVLITRRNTEKSETFLSVVCISIRLKLPVRFRRLWVCLLRLPLAV